jgi:hypothetical protein
MSSVGVSSLYVAFRQLTKQSCKRQRPVLVMGTTSPCINTVMTHDIASNLAYSEGETL